ncbi:MAG: hypothetical protein JWN86_777 [Planctomycetota bacterium]|nr:hypothetical protein [Planctomycetota bacterium]
MSETSNQPFEIVESFDLVSYRPPRQGAPIVAVFGVVLTLIGLIPLGCGIGFLGLILYAMRSSSPAEIVLFAMLTAIVPLVFIAAGLALIFIGLYMITGRDEVVLTNRDVRTVMHVGPFHWARSMRRDRLRQFTVVQRLDAEQSPALAHSRWSLRAEDDRGRSKDLLRAYPHDLLRALADDLAVRSRTLPLDSAEMFDVPGKVVVREESDVPTDVRQRVEQPVGSTATLETLKDGIRISIPPKGFRQGSSFFAKVFVIFWCLITGIMTTTFASVILSGGEIKREGGFPQSNWFLVLFFTPFVLIGIGGVLTLIQGARRRADLTVSGGSLQIERWEWFRTKRDQWPRDALRSLGVHVRKNVDSEGATTYENSLRIEFKDGIPVSVLSRYGKTELEWVATMLRRALDLPSN